VVGAVCVWAHCATYRVCACDLQTQMPYCAHISWMRHPFEESLDVLPRCLPELLSSDSVVFAWGCLFNTFMEQFMRGESIGALAATCIVNVRVVRDELGYDDGLDLVRAPAVRWFGVPA